ncbi:MAG: UvrD-helicase domain-containing protein [Castellaniella sp.]
MIAGLNPQQRAAVTLPEQHALVLAGAGSGKTRVLVTRLAWLIDTGRVSPWGVMAVTFTNKAAREMLARLGAQLPLQPRGMWVGTFHGLCNRLLRAHHAEVGLPADFQILDMADQQAAIRRLLKSLQVDDSLHTPRDVQNFINKAKESGLRPDAMRPRDMRERHMVEFYLAYQQQCDREGVVDFAELLLRATELLQNNEAVRRHYQERFRHILVDEFQDTNALQYRWLLLLARGGAHIFAVGDDDQSIYAFRGANVGNMADFQRNYAHDTVIRLEQNYRSSGHILNAANALIAHNESRLGKNLWTDAGEGERIRVCEQPTDGMEAQWLVDEIRALVREGRPRDEIAVLYRSNAQSRVLEHALFSAGLPYKVTGGLRFFERQEVKHALAYLRLMLNLQDDTSWLRVVNFPPRGIGMRSLERLADVAREQSCSLSEAVPGVSGASGTRLGGFLDLIHRLSSESETMTLPDLVAHVVEHSGLQAHYQQDREGEDRLENLRELVSAAAAFVVEEGWEDWPAIDVDAGAGPDADPLQVMAGLSPLAAFLSHASLEAGDNQAQSGEDAIQLMTVHAAKGLEFDVVFMTGLEDGLFPHENSAHDPAGMEEERRLMYVAITRARQRLYLSLAQSRMLHGKTRYSRRSRFLDEIPDENLKWLTAREIAGSGDGLPTWGGAFRRGGHSFQGSGQSLAPMAPRTLGSSVRVRDQEFRIGQGVRHARFGEGTITSLSGNGLDAQARIQFSEVGAKTLALGIAKLEIIAG